MISIYVDLLDNQKSYVRTGSVSSYLNDYTTHHLSPDRLM